jgi:CRP-like cAMP-binding protein
MSLETIISIKPFTKQVDGQSLSFHSSEKLMLITIAFCNAQRLRTSYAVLGRYCGCSVSTIVRSLNTLLKLGLISKQNNVDLDSGCILSNRYEIDVEAISKLEE